MTVDDLVGIFLLLWTVRLIVGDMWARWRAR